MTHPAGLPAVDPSRFAWLMGAPSFHSCAYGGELARTLIRREPHNIMHVIGLGRGHGPPRRSRRSPLRVSLAVELLTAGQVDDAKRVLKAAFELDPDRRLVVLDHPGLSAIWRPP